MAVAVAIGAGCPGQLPLAKAWGALHTPGARPHRAGRAKGRMPARREHAGMPRWTALCVTVTTASGQREARGQGRGVTALKPTFGRAPAHPGPREPSCLPWILLRVTAGTAGTEGPVPCPPGSRRVEEDSLPELQPSESDSGRRSVRGPRKGPGQEGPHGAGPSDSI